MLKDFLLLDSRKAALAPELTWNEGKRCKNPKKRLMRSKQKE
jgi:hypothetical protein